MMITIQQLQNGINRFVDEELTAQMDGWKKLAVETVVGLYMVKFPAIIESLAANPMITPLALYENGMIDIDAVYHEAAKHFESPISFQIPAIGAFELTKENLDTLYRMIKQGGNTYGF